jgi:ATP-dependent Clp protease ATP-binding subunit ClpA
MLPRTATAPSVRAAAAACRRSVRLHAACRSIRIMAADRVPGVKSVSGAPVLQPVSAQAAAAAAKMEAAVRAQRQQRARALAEAREGARVEAMPQQQSGGHLRSLRSALDRRIDGQSAAKDVVGRALRRRLLGLSDADRPLRLLFAGPSGVGKTELGIACCEALLGRRAVARARGPPAAALSFPHRRASRAPPAAGTGASPTATFGGGT